MLHCERCKLDITGAPERCPLCQGPLTGDGDPLGGVFVPLEEERKKLGMVFSFITMAALAVGVISLTVNYLLERRFTWSLLVTGGALCAWIFAVVGWRKRQELAKNIFLQTTLVNVAALLWDFSTGWRGWSLSYVLPGVCVAAILALSVLALVLKLDSSDYMAYLWVVSIYGFLPLLFVVFKLVNVIYPSIICFAICLLTLAALLLFFRRISLDELKKKLHI